MARYRFGGGLADWSFGTAVVATVPDLAQLVGAATITFWTAETGGDQYVDLLDADGAPINSIQSADGSGSRALGQLPPFFGPDGVTEMWAQGGNGPRAIITASGAVSAALQQASATDTALITHTAAANPHGTRLADLTDATVGEDPAGRSAGDVVGVLPGGGFGLLGMSTYSRTLLLVAPAVGSYPVWRATEACRVAAVHGYRRGGTGAAVNAHAGGVPVLAVDLSVANPDVWLSGVPAGAVSLAEGDTLAVDVVSLAGGPSQIVVQVDLVVV